MRRSCTVRAQCARIMGRSGRGDLSNSFAIREEDGGRDRDRTGDPLLAKQVLSQLSYTPTVGVALILKHFRAHRNPFLRFSAVTVPKLYQNPGKRGLFAPRRHSFRWLGG
jgi:hypothetical protein